MEKVAQGVGSREAAMNRIVTEYLGVKTTAMPAGGRSFYQDLCLASRHSFRAMLAVH